MKNEPKFEVGELIKFFCRPKYQFGIVKKIVEYHPSKVCYYFYHIEPLIKDYKEWTDTALAERSIRKVI